MSVSVFHTAAQLFSVVDKSLVPYRQCSAGRVRPAEDFGASIVDTAIWSGPLAFAVDAVSLWGLNRLSHVTD